MCTWLYLLLFLFCFLVTITETKGYLWFNCPYSSDYSFNATKTSASISAKAAMVVALIRQKIIHILPNVRWHIAKGVIVLIYLAILSSSLTLNWSFFSFKYLTYFWSSVHLKTTKMRPLNIQNSVSWLFCWCFLLSLCYQKWPRGSSQFCKC